MRARDHNVVHRPNWAQMPSNDRDAWRAVYREVAKIMVDELAGVCYADKEKTYDRLTARIVELEAIVEDDE